MRFHPIRGVIDGEWVVLRFRVLLVGSVAYRGMSWKLIHSSRVGRVFSDIAGEMRESGMPTRCAIIACGEHSRKQWKYRICLAGSRAERLRICSRQLISRVSLSSRESSASLKDDCL